jgi:hypothetical protein
MEALTDPASRVAIIGPSRMDHPFTDRRAPRWRRSGLIRSHLPINPNPTPSGACAR